MISSGYEQRKARIEMLPLIDVVFLLLVFFIYAMLSMVVHRGLRVELPSAATAEVDRYEYVGITITKDNTLFVGEERVELNVLVDAVKQRMKGAWDLPVFINGDRRSDLGMAVRILDLLKSAGIREVSIECAEEAP
ncbi:MAG: biopolymer transporter ExbD [Acidobacteria bacterium]|nr:biopolymer transporter ExbD [Acidobacteriota bacterium]